MSDLWRIELLGNLRAVHSGSGRSISRFRTHKVGALLAYLAFHANRYHPREVLAERFWPGSSFRAGRASLSVALSSLRHQLDVRETGASALLQTEHLAVRLNPALVTTDVAEFEAALRAASGAAPSRATGSTPERVEMLARAADLYAAGPLLPGYYDAWIEPEQERLAGLWFDAVAELAGLLDAAGNSRRALSYARRLVAADPLREEGQLLVMRLLLDSGQPEAALRQYREWASGLSTEMGEAPPPAARALAEQAKQAESRMNARPYRGAQVARYGFDAMPAHVNRIASSGTLTFLLMDAAPGTRALFSGSNGFVHPGGGQIVEETSERLLLVFAAAGDALACAVRVREALRAGPFRVRLALHTGDVAREEDKKGYEGPVLRRIGRILGAIHPGQIVCSEVTAGALQLSPETGLCLKDLGVYRLPAADGMPGETPERLFQVDAAPDEMNEAFPPLRAEAGSAGNLPPDLTRFFGRGEECARLHALLLSPHTRLLTLTGPGGVGKTRLAIEVARQIARSPERSAAWFATLAGATEAGQIAGIVRDALRLRLSPETPPLEPIVAALSRQPSLLVLDNFEHLAEQGGAAFVWTLLTHVPNLTCLVTSRQRLGLSAEREFALSPLPIPGETEPATPEHLRGCASVELFVDRAQASRPDFQITRANAPTIARLCARLEGIPLAIELAAARAQSFTLSQMLARLDNRFDFLVGRARDLAPRHRTLRAAMDWSFDLLRPDLRRFFAALSVFRGSWTAEAAQVVAADDTNDDTVLEFLTELRACSLLLAHEIQGEPQPMRFRLLETVREYAAEQLPPGERAEREARHAAYYAALAEQSEQALTAREPGRFADWLDDDRDNFEAALAWTERESAIELGLRLGGALWWRWRMRADTGRGREWLARILEMDARDPAQATDRAALRARAQSSAGLLASAQGDHAASRLLLESALVTQRALGDQAGVAAALNSLGSAARAQGDLGAAHGFLEESLRLWRGMDSPRGVAIALNNLASVLQAQGDESRAQAVCTEALEICRARGYRGSHAWSLHILGQIAEARGDAAAAWALYEQGLALRRLSGAASGIADTLDCLGRLAHARGDFDAARTLYAESLALRRELGDLRGVAAPLLGLADAETCAGNFAAALPALREGIELARDLGDISLVVAGLAGRARLDAARGRAAEAARLLGAAHALRQTTAVPLPPDEDTLRAELRVALGNEAFAAAWAAGGALSREEAVACALAPGHP